MEGFQSQRYVSIELKPVPATTDDHPKVAPPPYPEATGGATAETSQPLAFGSDVGASAAPQTESIKYTFTETPEDANPSPPARGRRRYSPNTAACTMGNAKTPLIIVGIIVGIVAALVMIIVPMSFSTLEFYEYGFMRRKTTGEIDRSVVYGPGGRHFLGPDYEFRVMMASAQFESFNRVTVFASDRLEVTISAHLQYFLRKDQLHLLHKKYDVRYRSILLTNALNALKNRATDFETREFIYQRTRIERELFLAIREMLSGPCCEQGCTSESCIPGCKQQCSESEYGFYVDVRYFQLDALEVPEDLAEKFLRALVLKEESRAEEYKQNGTVVRKETDALIKQIQNEAREIRQDATSQSELLRSVATANATAIVENARSEGLKHLYGQLDITNPQQKASFDYLRTLRGQENVHLAVDFDQLIAGGLTGNNRL